jgi:hypothetical protein
MLIVACAGILLHDCTASAAASDAVVTKKHPSDRKKLFDFLLLQSSSSFAVIPTPQRTVPPQ